MRGRKTSYEDKLKNGTLNKTRDKQPTPANPEVASYLSQINVLLNKYWNNLNDDNLPLKEQELYLDMFLKLQKHYFSYKDYVPKDGTVADKSIIEKLVSNKNA